MSFKGFLIKNFIELNDILTSKSTHPEKTQQQQLEWLLHAAKDTEFGKKYNFSKILSSENIVARYQANVPIFEYDEMNELWWKRQQTESDITWKGKPNYFALSSGTTGESKRIPVTNDMIACIQSVGKKQIASLANFDLPSKLFGKEILMLGSSTQLKNHNKHLEGEITGISAMNLPFWFKGFYRPGKEIAEITDWDTKAELIAAQATNWDIVAISGIPFWMILMIKKVIEYHQLETIHDIWPNLTIYATGGVAFEPYRAKLNCLTARPLQIMDTYFASEGFLAYNARPNTMVMQLAIENKMFFEFIPVDKRGFEEDGNLVEKPLILSWSDLEENKEYALLISTPAGAWRYMIGDIIKFTSLKNYEIILSGRAKYFLNVIGAQLTEEKMNTAILQLGNELGIQISEYCVAALVDEQDEYYHQWILGINGKIDNEKAAHRLDEILQFLNHNYSSSRSKVLKYVCLEHIPSSMFYDWLEIGKVKGGQMKVPRVMNEKRMNNLLEYIGSQVSSENEKDFNSQIIQSESSFKHS